MMGATDTPEGPTFVPPGAVVDPPSLPPTRSVASLPRATVTDPEQHGTFRKYVDYSVSYFGADGHLIASVRRRYSDFHWLREVLCSRYRGMLIVPLPGKEMKSFWNPSDMEFLKKRMAGLDRFMVGLLVNPYLRSDALVNNFLCTASDKEWSSKKKTISNVSREQVLASCPGLVAWEKAANTHELGDEFKPNKQLEAVRDQHKSISESISEACGVSQKLCTSATTLGTASKNFQQRLDVQASSIANLQQSSTTTGLADVAARMGDAADVCQVISAAWHKWSLQNTLLPDYLELFFKRAEESRQRDAEALTVLLKTHAKTVAKYSKEWTAKEKLAFQLQKVTDAAATPLDSKTRQKLDKIGVELGEASTKAGKTKANMELESRAILHTELARTSSNDVTCIRGVFEQFAATQIEVLDTQRNMWLETLLALKADVDQCKLEAKQSLTGGIAGKLVFQPYPDHDGSARSCRTATLIQDLKLHSTKKSDIEEKDEDVKKVAEEDIQDENRKSNSSFFLDDNNTSVDSIVSPKKISEDNVNDSVDVAWSEDIPNSKDL